MKTVNVLLFSGVLAVFFCGCKADPARCQSKFLGQEDRLYADPTCKAFHKVWVDPDFKDWGRFKKVYFAPVDTKYLRQMNWWGQLSTNIDRDKSAREIASYMRKEFIKAHRNNPKHTLEVVDKADDQTLVTELAITELVPTKVWLNAAGYYFIWSAVDRGSIAMEGRIRDGKNGKILCKFMDRELGRVSIANVRDLTWYYHARGVIDDWASQSVELVNADDNDVVEDSSAFTLLPW